MHIRIITALIGLLVSSQAIANDELQTAATPDWVVTADFDFVDIPYDQKAAGAEMLLSDQQQNFSLSVPEFYQRQIYQLQSFSSLNQNPSIPITFFPEFQTLKIHELAIWRNGEKRDALSNLAYQVSRQETVGPVAIAREVSMSIFVMDLRGGDVLEIAYSIRGQRPDFLGRIFGSVILGSLVPVEQMTRRLIVSEATNLKYRLIGGLEPPKIKHNKGTVEYIWESENVEEIEFESSVPNWFSQIPAVEFADFGDWSEVVDWGNQHFHAFENPSQELQDKTKELVSRSDKKHEQLRAILGYMQSQIRYVGEDLGRSGYEPFDPTVTFNRAFGDCKDQSVLMVTMLRRAGVNAWTALVNESSKGAVDRNIPSPMAFDHSIVLAQIDGEDYWLDPTRSLEEGRPASLEPVEHLRALVLREGETGLSEIPNPFEGESSFSAELRYHFDVMGGPKAAGDLSVTRLFKGNNANLYMMVIDNFGIDKVGEFSTQQLSQEIDGIEADGAPRMLDVYVDGTVIVEEDYTIPTAWVYDKADERWEFGFKAVKIDALLLGYRALAADRSTPLALDYPFKVREEISYRVPEDWELQPVSFDIETPYFRFRERSHYSGNAITITVDFESLRDHVLVEDLEDFRSAAKKARENLDYFLYANGPENNPVAGTVEIIEVDKSPEIELEFSLPEFPPPDKPGPNKKDEQYRE